MCGDLGPEMWALRIFTGSVLGPEMCELGLPRYGEPVLSLCPRCGSPSFTQGNRREISLNLQPMDSLQVISETEEFLEGDLGL